MEMELVSLAGIRPQKPDKRKRARQACDHCRAKKIRCNGESTSAAPCPNCVDRGRACVTTSRTRSRRDRSTYAGSQILQNGLDDSIAVASPQSYSVPADEAHRAGADDAASVSVSGPVPESGSVLPSDMTNWEYHGARSYMSVCSQPAIRWISEQTRDPSFADVASAFVIDVTGRLKMGADISTSRAPEPDAETARLYTKAYFENALDAAMGVVHRPWFEQQLEAHLSGNPNEASPTWHALRNVIYAAGCRIVLAKAKTCTFEETSRRAWLYFENALAVYARLLFYKTSVTGVQVLTLMAYYTHNLGTPCLEYMLIADAVRLAFAKGLHQASPSGHGLTTEDVEQRSRLFWAIYCLEKQIACQASRPSIINDDEIACPMPSAESDGSTFSPTYCLSLIDISRLSSTVDKRLSVVRCLRIGAAATVQSVHQLQDDLDHIKTSLHNSLGVDLGVRIDQTRLPKDISFEQMLYLQFAYSTVVLSVHTILAYPWLRPLLGLDNSFRNAIIRSSDRVAQVSREIIMMTESIHFTAYTTLPIGWFVPIYALISLFVYRLDRRRKDPSDLAFMDIGTGYFARIRLATDSLVSTPFARSITSLAYQFEGDTGLAVDDDGARIGTTPITELDETYWQPDLMDVTRMFHIEDWSTFAHTSPVSTPLTGLF